MALVLIRSALFNVTMISWTVFLYVLYLPTMVCPPRVLVSCVHFWIRGLYLLQSGLLGLSFSFRGMDNLPDGAFILASAHQSAWDTIAFYALFRRPAYIVKEELTLIPGFAVYARKAGLITIDRSGRTASARNMLRNAREVVSAGGQVVIFPEGTRVPPGRAISIHAGVNALYRYCNVPVVPVSLNSGLYWGRRSFIKRPGTILVEFGKPIEPGLSSSEFETRLADRINTGNLRLLVEAGFEAPETDR